eukprot:GSChrysophyteH1.ASY1.ANO1.124.1 assembled CDS
MGLPPAGHASIIGIDSARWLKLCKDGKLMDKKFRKVDVDLVFAKHAKQRRLGFEGFQYSLVEIALKKETDGEVLVENLLANTVDGPSIKGSYAKPTRLHDDKSTYTGVYKAGGPTITDYEKQGMSNLCDRTKRATVRGVPELAVYGPGGNVGEENHGNAAASEIDEEFALDGNSMTMDTFMSKITPLNARKAIIPKELYNKIKALFRVYTAASSRSIDSARFLKLMKDGKIFDKHFRYCDIDVIFSKHQDKRRLNIEAFKACLLEIALKKMVNVSEIITKLESLAETGPSLSGTYAEQTRLHDDKTTYTGVYKAGGPSTVNYENPTMAALCDRTKRATSILGKYAVKSSGKVKPSISDTTSVNRSFKEQQHLKEDPDIDVYDGPNCGIDSSKFNKLCVDAGLFDKSFTRSDVDILFTKHRSSARKMNFEGFQNAMLEMAFKKGIQLGKLLDSVAPLAIEGPHNHGTIAEANRFYDDQSTYTGVASHSDHLMSQKELDTNDYEDGDGPGSEGGKLLQIDMSVTQQQLMDVQHIYENFCSQSKRHSGEEGEEFMDSSRFNKLCVDAGLFDANFPKETVDIIFTKHKSSTIKRRMDFEGFQNALLEIAMKKRVALGSMIDEMIGSAYGGPSNNHGTIAEHNRFYDDKSTYTGAAKVGGIDTRQKKGLFS